MISIVILTLNEEVNIKQCLESASFSDDIIVIDSGSTDKTIEICNTFGVKIIHKKLESWSSHQNWINETVEFKNKWVYYSDADEIITNELRTELLEISVTESETVAYRVRYKNYFMGKWLKYSGGYPIWVLRFFIPSKVRWERLVNPTPIVSGKEGKLNSHFLHYSFNKGMDAWFEKHNKYSKSEALEGVKIVLKNKKIPLKNIFSKDPAVRRRTLKELSFLMPFRGLMRFMYQYIICFGFLDGSAGLQWCILNSIYEHMIEIKIKEIRRRSHNLPI